jgi:hypothetical protein
VSTRVEGATVRIMVSAQATLAAGEVHLSMTVKEGPAQSTWRYNLQDDRERRVQYGRVAGIADHMGALRYAAGVFAAAYEPGTLERGLFEQFAADTALAAGQPEG